MTQTIEFVAMNTRISRPMVSSRHKTLRKMKSNDISMVILEL